MKALVVSTHVKSNRIYESNKNLKVTITSSHIPEEFVLSWTDTLVNCLGNEEHCVLFVSAAKNVSTFFLLYQDISLERPDDCKMFSTGQKERKHTFIQENSLSSIVK